MSQKQLIFHKSIKFSDYFFYCFVDWGALLLFWLLLDVVELPKSPNQSLSLKFVLFTFVYAFFSSYLLSNVKSEKKLFLFIKLLYIRILTFFWTWIYIYLYFLSLFQWKVHLFSKLLLKSIRVRTPYIR